MVKHGQGFRFCQEWKEELTRFPDGLGIRCGRKSRIEAGSKRKRESPRIEAGRTVGGVGLWEEG